MTTSNLSIVDSLIRSHFGSNLWTKITDINFFNDDRIRQINQCFKDLPVKSKLYILMALGNLNNTQFIKWKIEVESIFLRAMVEGNLLVRAIATILQQKFNLNYLTFDISLSLENFADILIKLTSNMDDWDMSCECIVAEYISENVVIEMMKHIEGSKSNTKIKNRKRKIENDDEKSKSNIGCKLKYLPKSFQIKEQYLQKIEAECNKKRISVPIPGRNKIKPKEENEINDEKEMSSRKEFQIIKENAQIRKDRENNAKLEDFKKRLQQKSVIGKKETKVICLSLDELPPTGPKAKQIIREKEKEAKKVEKEEKLKKAKEEKEADKLRKMQEKENKRIAHQMMLEQTKKEKAEIEMQQMNANIDPALSASGAAVVQGLPAELVEEDSYLPIPINYPPNQIQQAPPQFVSQISHQIRVLHPEQANYQIIEKPNANIRFISSPNMTQSVFRPPLQQQQSQTNPPPQIVLIQSPTQIQNTNQISQQPSYILSTNQTGVKLVRLVSNNQTISAQQQPQQQQQQQRLVRIIGSSSNNNQSNNNNNNSQSSPACSTTPTINITTRNFNHLHHQSPHNIAPPTQQQQQQQQQPVSAINNVATQPAQSPQQTTVPLVNPQSMQLETMKILIRYANRLSRPQKAMIVSYIAGSADGVDFNGQSSVHISSHRAINLDTFQPLNVIVDAFFLMDYRTGRWSIVKQYREPRNEEDICSFDLQPSGYPPEFSMQA